MSIRKDVKCPNQRDLVQERESRPSDEFAYIQHIQTGLNELINRVRRAFVEEKLKTVSCSYFDESHGDIKGYSFEDVTEIKRIMKSKHFRVSYNRGQGMGGCIIHVLKVRVPRRGN